jgi:TRAP-type C4-dicarboxylate transport system permease small subunit
MSVPAVLVRAQQAYVTLVSGLAAFMMAATVVVTCLQVFFRYFMHDSLIWAEEICRYMLVWTSFLVAGVAFQRGELASMDLLSGMMPAWARAVLLAPAYVASVAFLLVVAWYGYGYAETNSTQAMPAADFISQSLFKRDSGMSIWWVYISVPVGCGLLAVHFAVSSVRLVMAPFRSGGA